MMKHKCKLCLKTFPNGKALGGHMRSHMLNLYVNPKPPPHSSSSSSASETETKSLRRNSKRIRKSTPEPVSSISNTSPEEDVAYCLMMLSRDKWSETESESEFERIRVRNKYTCETCNKVFRSYQALGGHRASHKKIKSSHGNTNNNQKTQIVLVHEDKVHQCPVCFRVFGSGQALGGHKRSHVMTKHVVKQRVNLIDLNLPAPIDDGDDDYEVSQFEASVVSDGE